MQEVTIPQISFPQITYRENENCAIADSNIQRLSADIPPSFILKMATFNHSFPTPGDIKNQIYSLGQQLKDTHDTYLRHALNVVNNLLSDPTQIQILETGDTIRDLTILKNALTAIQELYRQQSESHANFIDISQFFTIAQQLGALNKHNLEAITSPLKSLNDVAASETQYIDDFFNFEEDKYYRLILDLYDLGSELLTLSQETKNQLLSKINQFTQNLYNRPPGDSSNVINQIYHELCQLELEEIRTVSAVLAHPALFLPQQLFSEVNLHFYSVYHQEANRTDCVIGESFEQLLEHLKNSDPHLVQFESLNLAEPDKLSISTSAIVFYPDQAPIRHPKDIPGIARETTSASFPFYRLIQDYKTHVKGLKTYTDADINLILNITWQLGDSPNARDIDIHRILGIYDNDQHIKAFKKVFPANASPQALLDINMRQINLHNTPNVDYSLSFNRERNSLLLIECAFLYWQIPDFHFQPNVSTSGNLPTTHCGNYNILPSDASHPAFNIYFIEHNASDLISFDEEEIEQIRTHQSYIIQQPQNRFIATRAKLHTTRELQINGVTQTKVVYRERVQDDQTWGYAITKNNTVVFCSLEIDHTLFRQQYDLARHAVRVKQSRKRSLTNCIKNCTGGKHDKPLLFLDADFLTSQGQWFAQHLGFAKDEFQPSFLDTTLKIHTSKNKEPTISHVNTFLTSSQPQLFTHQNGRFIQPKATEDKSTSINNRIIDYVDYYHNRPKSLTGLFVALLVIVLALLSIFILEKLYLVAAICFGLIIGGSILYRCNWLHYFYGCIYGETPSNKPNKLDPKPVNSNSLTSQPPATSAPLAQTDTTVDLGPEVVSTQPEVGQLAGVSIV
ncbi:MAG: hypothetical protein VXW87_03255 [Pseudomonadota bacterium]|nr:hypothetical protein [Pseudomonadota bacterium]